MPGEFRGLGGSSASSYNRVFTFMPQPEVSCVADLDPTDSTDFSGRGPLRIGGVTYLNSKPLVCGLPRLEPGCSVFFDLPSRLADSLAAGGCDTALVPVAELATHPDWGIVSDACVACTGPVLSVKVLFRVPPGEVKTLALDEGSRTSAALAQVLLADIHGLRPELSVLPIGCGPETSDADAVLLIGDRAIGQSEEGFVESWDLGDRWFRWTELPMVFAVWAVRPGVPRQPLREGLAASRDLGVQQLDRLAREGAEALDLPLALCEKVSETAPALHSGAAGDGAGCGCSYERAAGLGLLPEVDPGRLDIDDSTVGATPNAGSPGDP